MIIMLGRLSLTNLPCEDPNCFCCHPEQEIQGKKILRPEVIEYMKYLSTEDRWKFCVDILDKVHAGDDSDFVDR